MSRCNVQTALLLWPGDLSSCSVVPLLNCYSGDCNCCYSCCIATTVAVGEGLLCSCGGVSDLVLSIRLLSCYSGGNSLFVVGGQVSSCGGGLFSNCIRQRFSTVVSVCGGALLQMWCMGTCLIMVSCMSLIVGDALL